jgi:hypothetical protein
MLRALPVEGHELLAGGLYAEQTGKLLDRSVKASSIGESRDDAQADRHLTTKRIGARHDHGLDGLKPVRIR